MTLTIAAAGAAVTAILEVTLWPYLDVFGAHPHPVLVGAVLWATLAALESSLAWAFTGGLMLDVLSPRPLGTSILTLLVVAGLAALAARLLAEVRLRVLAPILVALPLSVAYSFGVVAIVAGVERTLPPRDAIPSLLPGAVIDTALVGIAVAAALVLRRRDEPERVGW